MTSPAARPRGRDGRPSREGRPRYAPRRRVCAFCVEKVKAIDYKDVDRLRRYISPNAKVDPRRRTGTCARHQRLLRTAVQRARQVALLPLAHRHIAGD